MVKKIALITGAAALLIIASFMTWTMVVKKASAKTPEYVIHYFNGDVQSDSATKFNFGPDRWAAATKAVNAGKATSVNEYVLNDLFVSITPSTTKGADPALAAALAYYMDHTMGTQILQPNETPDQAHLRFVKDLKADGKMPWPAAVAKMKAILLPSDAMAATVQPIKGKYTYQAYMHPNGLEGNKPSVVTSKGTNTGGNELVITLASGKVFRVRLECGYQPETTGWWTPKATGGKSTPHQTTPSGLTPKSSNPAGYTRPPGNQRPNKVPDANKVPGDAPANKPPNTKSANGKTMKGGDSDGDTVQAPGKKAPDDDRDKQKKLPNEGGPKVNDTDPGAF
ncbi:hypothetical protein FWF48_02090 [Candidatus Saccharibacteria bacterium]|nr:hypothetical protein [Candidatus Saccharibacteria bacterium]